MEDDKKTYIVVSIVAAIIFIAIIAVIMLDGKENKKEEVAQNNTANTILEDENTFDYTAAAEKQMAEASDNETIAIMHVKDYGDITFKFFKDEAPKAVENFLTHAKDGYYNGTKFHRIIDEFMIQGGDPKGNGTGGESIWNVGFEEEISEGLVPYRGALCMASAGTGTSTIGSQFFIVQANSDEDKKEAFARSYSKDFAECYMKYGGSPNLYKNYTVFGQVVKGMDVVDKIAKVEVTLTSSGEESLPVEDVIVESIDVIEK